MRKCSRLILERPVCYRCVLQFVRDPQTCPGRGEPRVLAFYDSQRRPACATCTGNPASYACPACGREHSQWGSRCAPRGLAERAAALLSRPTGSTHSYSRFTTPSSPGRGQRPPCAVQPLNRA